ncbi:MAG: hypothetical protein A2X18_05645 [Bacteroidetes bacterium GWF2_40_14]|nr:MAG: hypothetical protein A2X18_05645 [Bacteroidetes bacterium GWF2_40_14]
MTYGTILWTGILAAVATFLIIPETHHIFVSATNAHPYLMGFVKFAILSIMGEYLANRLVHKKWVMVNGVFVKMMIWGILGVMIVLMFSILSQGVQGAIGKGVLHVGDTWASPVIRAFYISAIMNLTFAPVFMATHRITDTYIDAYTAGKRMSVQNVISSVEWPGFMSFVIGKTIPFFWIPAHTITFLLPDEYKVIFAASLSIVLGLILSYAKLQKTV